MEIIKYTRITNPIGAKRTVATFSAIAKSTKIMYNREVEEAEYIVTTISDTRRNYSSLQEKYSKFEN